MVRRNTDLFAGKTVLASVIIDACEKVKNSHTAYFYCNYDDQETNTMIAILKGLLMQAVNWRPELMSYFDEQRKQSGESTISKEQTAKRLMNLICHDGGQTYLVIDGIDECSSEERKNTLTFLSAVVQEVDQKSPGKLRLLVISQNEPDVRRALVGAAELEIENTLNGRDIQSYAAQLTEKIHSKFDLDDDDDDAIRNLHRRTCWYAAGISNWIMKHAFTD